MVYGMFKTVVYVLSIFSLLRCDTFAFIVGFIILFSVQIYYLLKRGGSGSLYSKCTWVSIGWQIFEVHACF